MREGKLREKLNHMHERYGPIVRYGVNSISMNDPESISTIYVSRSNFTSADSYGTLVGVSNGKVVYSLVSAPDTMHAALRRSISGAFTPAAVLEYEKYIDETIPELFYKLEARKTFDFAEIMTFYSMDAASRFTFNETLGCLRTNSDVGGMIETVRQRGRYWGVWSSLPQLERQIYRNPITIKLPRAKSSMVKLASSKVQGRVAEINASNGVVKKDDLLQRLLQASSQHPQTLDTLGVVGKLMSVISGAGDTTSTTAGAIFYFLFKQPRVQQKLREELQAADLPLIPAYAITKDIPYLDAVIKESMRLFPLLNIPLGRKVPRGGITLAGKFLPEGSTVGVLQSTMHHNKTVYGDDHAEFRPERWVENSPSQLKIME